MINLPFVPRDVPETLRAAADLIEENGHCKGNYNKEISGKTHFCIIGALRYVGANTPNGDRLVYYPGGAIPQLEQYLFENYNNISIASWNDNPKRKKAQIIRILRKAADNANNA